MNKYRGQYGIENASLTVHTRQVSRTTRKYEDFELYLKYYYNIYLTDIYLADIKTLRFMANFINLPQDIYSAEIKRFIFKELLQINVI